jgi:hypothetical protein
MVQEAKSPVKNLDYIYIYIYTHVKFLALLGAPYIYDISRLRVNNTKHLIPTEQTVRISTYMTDSVRPASWEQPLSLTFDIHQTYQHNTKFN